MKVLATILLSLVCSSSIFAENDSKIIDLEPAIIRLADQTPTIEIKYVPELPASLMKEDGHVVLKFIVNKSGRVSNIEVVDRSCDKLAKYSRGMVRRWEFKSLPHAVTAIQPIYFEVDKKTPTLLALR